MALYGQRTFNDYARAERFADEWAGDNAQYAAVVDHGDGWMSVMDYEVAASYVRDHDDAEIIYDADHRPICPLCLRRSCDEHEAV